MHMIKVNCAIIATSVNYFCSRVAWKAPANRNLARFDYRFVHRLDRRSITRARLSVGRCSARPMIHVHFRLRISMAYFGIIFFYMLNKHEFDAITPRER